MSTDDLQKFYRYGFRKWVGPYYYDHPDGEDLPGKLSFCGQMAFLISATVGLYNAYTVYPYPTTQRGKFFRVFRAVLPGVGMGLAFATTTYYMTKIRQKDDAINHMLGGFAAGTICGAANGLPYGIPASIILGSIAFVVKACHEASEKRKYVGPKQISPYLKRLTDFSSVPSGQGNWVKAPPPQN